MVPTLFGFPIWEGRIKRRVAKKHLRRWGISRFLDPKFLKRYEGYGVGSYINDCTGFNGKILSITPEYRGLSGLGGAVILMDLDFQTENTGCCFRSCGVEPALSREVIEARMLDFTKNWALGEGGKTWYGKDYDKEAERARNIVSILESGGHVADEFGVLLPEFKRR